MTQEIDNTGYTLKANKKKYILDKKLRQLNACKNNLN